MKGNWVMQGYGVGVRGERLRHAHLRGHRTFALELRLIAVKRLLPAILQVVAGVMLWEAMLTYRSSVSFADMTQWR